MPHPGFSESWLRKLSRKLISIIGFFVYLILDFLDAVFCYVYKVFDECLEGQASQCYCHGRNRGEHGNDNYEDEAQISETLYTRRNAFRQLGFLASIRKVEDYKKRGRKSGGPLANRWSDCGCDSCVSWMKDSDPKLHLVVREPSLAKDEEHRGKPIENVVFLHGFISSSSFWTETVFPAFSEPVKRDYRLIGLDLLGFGKSPKPRDCYYTLKDHSEMIEKSVINPFQLSNFHLVAHSMGCIIALALAAKHPTSVKSITLVAPPYISSSENGASFNALEKLAGKKLWPPLAFGSSFMSWYEHLGRFVCFLVCRNHRIWEKLLKFIFEKRDLHFTILDLPRHTHHSAWHSMHNVICGGAKLVDRYLEVLNQAGVRIRVVKGDHDQVVPIECCFDMKLKAPNAEVSIIRNAGHGTVVFGREKEFAQYLERLWESTSTKFMR